MQEENFRHHSTSFCDKTLNKVVMDLPDGSVVNNSLTNARDAETQGLVLGWEDPWRKW